MRAILKGMHSVAVVGWSPNPDRPSHRIALFLADRGMEVWRINPGHAGRLVDGRPVAARLADLPPDAGIEMVDIFRRPDAVPAVVDEALSGLPDFKVIWMQLGITSPEAAARARLRGVTVVQNRCPRIEASRLL